MESLVRGYMAGKVQTNQAPIQSAEFPRNSGISARRKKSEQHLVSDTVQMWKKPHRQMAQSSVEHSLVRHSPHGSQSCQYYLGPAFETWSERNVSNSLKVERCLSKRPACESTKVNSPSTLE